VNPAEIRILVVDDDDDVARGTAHLLQQAGYATATAANGIEALRIAPAFGPNLVLSDRDMPEMDGMEMCRRIKADRSLADVFVVLISGTYTQSDEQSVGLEAGADSYIARPIGNRELVARVAAFVRILRLNQSLREKMEALRTVNQELARENARRRKVADARTQVIAELKKALAEVKTLSGMLPICCDCKKIRNDSGYWEQVDSYVSAHSNARFSHSFCPECAKRHFPGLALDDLK
jgi:DNA-binding response OmpR family regulator